MAGLSPADQTKVQAALDALRDTILAQTSVETVAQRGLDRTERDVADRTVMYFEGLCAGYLRGADSNTRQIVLQLRLYWERRMSDPYSDANGLAFLIPDLYVLLDPTLYRDDVADIVSVGDEFGLNAPERGDVEREGDVIRCTITAQFAIAVGGPPAAP